MAETPKRSLRKIAEKQNAGKLKGSPAVDPHTGAPCKHDAVKGSYNASREKKGG